jgi:murein DD-endopeptidase MepM/ murein hydrolase activator NlpD
VPLTTPDQYLERAWQRIETVLKRHPRRLTAALATLLAGAGVTAFAIAPLAPDAADLPRRLISEAVSPVELDVQLKALEEFAPPLYRSELTRAGDTIDALLARLGASDAAAAAFLRSDRIGRSILEGRAGKMAKAIVSAGQLQELSVRGPAASASQQASHFTRISISRQADGQFGAISEQVPLSASVRLGSGTILSTLFAAADESRLPDGITSQLAELFGTDIDFRRDLKRGDTFTVLYETLTADGEPVAWGNSTGRLLAAQFVNNGRRHDAVWFQEPGSKGGYFGLDGRSKNRMFLASPMAFSRVSSGFSMRFHPVLQSWRRHLGVDYPAPTGTAVRAVGDGVVTFSGWQNGYGNVVIVQHAGGRETRYAHLSRIEARRGARVEQGQTIGAVGATGWATGPHLHFEFLLGGRHVDPVQMARASESVTISAAARARFAETAQAASAQLAAAPAATDARFE